LEDDPAVVMNDPPAPAAADPTVREILPPVPPTALEEAIEIAPLFPLDVVPDEKVRLPLAPFAPELADLSFTDPDVVAVPSPPAREREPPV